MKKFTVPIKGMHCKSCELLIEEKLSHIYRIKKSQALYKKSQVDIYYEGKKPDQKQVKEAICQAGYSIGSEGKAGIFSRDVNDYKDLGVAFLLLMMIYFFLKNTGIINFSFSSSSLEPAGFWVVLLVGLTAGVSTCMAVVGGLVLGLSARHADRHPEATSWQKFRPHLFFNLGRVFIFALLGGLLGLVGSIFQLSSLTIGMITITVGLVMLVIGLQLIEIFTWINQFRFTLPKSLSRLLGIKDHDREYSHQGSFLLGGLTFFLPCGFTQAMQLYAISTGNFSQGVLVMGLFALGTAPGLLGIGGLTAAVKGLFARRFYKLAGLVLIIFALFNLTNGYNLTGWGNGRFSVENKNTEPVSLVDPNVTLENGVQIVKMKQLSGGYNPNKFTIRQGLPVRWVIDARDPYSCASSLVVPKLGISKRLQTGENVIEFTPKEAGVVKFSCSMGMYTGIFNVIN